jgi:hypothetical protein
MKEGSSVLVPRTSGGYSPGKILFIQDGKARVSFLLGETYRGQKNHHDPKEIGTKVVPVSQLIPIPEKGTPKIPISQYLEQGGRWEINESRLAWHGSNEVIITRVNNRWFNLHYVRSGTLSSANIGYMNGLVIAAENSV